MVEKTQRIPKGYKQTEIGIIPEDWEVKRLNDVVVKVIDNRGKTPPYSNNEEIELIETVSISFVNQYPDYSKVTKFVSADVYKNWFRGHPSKGDILISTVGEYSGSSAIMRENKGTIAQNLIALRIKEEVSPDFVFYWTRSRSFREQLDRVLMNQAQPSLRVPWLLNFFLSVPSSKSEQSAIAQVLSNIDALIENLDKLIAKKKAIKKGAMQELLTGKRRLPGFTGKWERKRLGEILDYERPDKYIVKNTEYSDNGLVPVLTANKSFILGYTNEDFRIYRKHPAIIFDDFTTESKYVDFPFKVKSSAIKILKCRDDNSNLKFIYEKMQLIKFPLGDHKRYYISEYQNIEINIPSKLEQSAIAQILSDMDAEIETLEKKRDKCKMIKQGAMQVLLTGKVRLVSIRGESG